MIDYLGRSVCRKRQENLHVFLNKVEGIHGNQLGTTSACLGNKLNDVLST